jgi:hypothetical protein
MIMPSKEPWAAKLCAALANDEPYDHLFMSKSQPEKAKSVMRQFKDQGSEEQFKLKMSEVMVGPNKRSVSTIKKPQNYGIYASNNRGQPNRTISDIAPLIQIGRN